MSAVYKLEDVFQTLQGKVPVNYYERPRVDRVFTAAHKAGVPIQVYGASKQGKTCLRVRNIPSDKSVVVQCSNDTDRDRLLRTVGGLLEAKSAVELPHTLGEQLKKQGRTLVIEEYHRVHPDNQPLIAQLIRIVVESGGRVVVVGAWPTDDDAYAGLERHDDGLSGRIKRIPTDQWSPDDLEEIVRISERLLNAFLEDSCRTALATRSHHSIFLTQRACYVLFNKLNIHETQSEKRTSLGSFEAAREAMKVVVREFDAKYKHGLGLIARGYPGRRAKDHDVYGWLAAYFVEQAPSLRYENAMPLGPIVEHILRRHPQRRTLSARGVREAAGALNNVQAAHKLDYLNFASEHVSFMDRHLVAWLNDLEDYDDRNKLIRALQNPRSLG